MTAIEDEGESVEAGAAITSEAAAAPLVAVAVAITSEAMDGISQAVVAVDEAVEITTPQTLVAERPTAAMKVVTMMAVAGVEGDAAIHKTSRKAGAAGVEATGVDEVRL